MPGKIFALIGPSGCGKTTLIMESVLAMPGLRIVVSTTTRPMRDLSEVRHYHFLGPDGFVALMEGGLLLNHARFGEHNYGFQRTDVELATRETNGICAMTPDGVKDLRAAGYQVIAIRVVPINQDGQIRPERADSDQHHITCREFPFNYQVENYFDPGGLDRSLAHLRDVIGANW